MSILSMMNAAMSGRGYMTMLDGNDGMDNDGAFNDRNGHMF